MGAFKAPRPDGFKPILYQIGTHCVEDLLSYHVSYLISHSSMILLFLALRTGRSGSLCSIRLSAMVKLTSTGISYLFSFLVILGSLLLFFCMGGSTDSGDSLKKEVYRLFNNILRT